MEWIIKLAESLGLVFLFFAFIKSMKTFPDL